MNGLSRTDERPSPEAHRDLSDLQLFLCSERLSGFMQQPTDLSASLLFNMGAVMSEVYLTDISLFNPPVGDLNQDCKVNLNHLEIFGVTGQSNSQDYLAT